MPPRDDERSARGSNRPPGSGREGAREEMPEEVWREGEVAALKRPSEPALLLRLQRGPVRIGDAAVLDLTAAIGRPVGGPVDWAGRRYRLVRPSLSDLWASMTRGPQIITPKDVGRILLIASVGPGAKVGEAGAGSGALTIALAHAVGPTGAVVSLDRRPEALRIARANVERAGLADRVTFVARDVAREGWPSKGQDAIVLDLADPWLALPPSLEALVPGGTLVTYVPTYNQLERIVRAMREAGLADVEALELLERPIHVGEGGTRPAFEMLGHTGFLAAGRRLDRT
ncbi:MAG: methyltransferase domain-containing protein [Thermoplasmata archaeon]